MPGRRPYPGVEDSPCRGHGLRRQRAGENKHADIGISLPGTFEEPVPRCSSTASSIGPCAPMPSCPSPAILDGYVETRFGPFSYDGVHTRAGWTLDWRRPRRRAGSTSALDRGSAPGQLVADGP